jgi:hypothetical protein
MESIGGCSPLLGAEWSALPGASSQRLSQRLRFAGHWALRLDIGNWVCCFVHFNDVCSHRGSLGSLDSSSARQSVS